MKILILGGTGILSTDFTKKVLSQQDEVYILNRGRSSSIIDSNLHTIVADLRNETVEDLRTKIKINKYDVVIDFLSFKPEHMEKTLDVLSGLFQQYIFISSATVYIKRFESEIITENNEIGNKTWDYAYNKYLCEEHLRAKPINYTIIRPYVTYGETRIPFPIIPNRQFTLIERIIEEKPVVLFEDGKAKCTLTSTKDFAEVLYRLLMNQKAYGQAFHITSPFIQTWADVYIELCSILGKSINPISVKARDIEKYFPEYQQILFGDKGTNMCFDNTNVMDAIGNNYEFKVDLSKGLKQSVDYYISHEQMQMIDCKFDGECDYYIYKMTGKRLDLLKNGRYDNKMYYYIMTNRLSHYGVNMLRKIRLIKITRGGTINN